MVLKSKPRRRDLLRAVEQGREAMRVLAAVVIDRGNGVLRVDREAFQRLRPDTRVEVHADPLTGNVTLKVTGYVNQTPS